MVKRVLEERQVLPTLPRRGCPECGRMRVACEQCQFIRWMTLAQNPVEWADIVNALDASDNGELSKVRRQRWTGPEEPWNPGHRLDVGGVPRGGWWTASAGGRG